MSAEPLMSPSPTSPFFHTGAAEVLGGVDPDGSPLEEIQTLRTFVNERLTAAVEDILGAFGRTVARYQEQIDRQRRQMDRLRSGSGSGSGEEKWNREADPLQDSSWIKDAPDHQVLVQTGRSDETDTGFSAAHIKTEAAGEDLDPASVLEAESEVPVLAEDYDTEDSEDYRREESGLCRPEETAAEGQRSDRERRSASDLQEHKQRPPEFSCRVCGQSFQRMSYLVAHTSAHPRACAVCGKHLELSGSLKRHLRVHRETTFDCSVCGQSFTQRGNLRTHMRIHSGERPFGCSVCGKSFGRRASLVRHIRSHTGEKPYSCSYCGRGFVEKGNLTVHLRTHTGERPYWCSVCERRFNQLSCFYKHPCANRGLISAPVAHS